MKGKIIKSICDFDVDFANEVDFGYHNCIDDDHYLAQCFEGGGCCIVSYSFVTLEEANRSTQNGQYKINDTSFWKVTKIKGGWNDRRLSYLKIQVLIDILAKLKSAKENEK